MALRRAQLASVWELQHGCAGLLPAWLISAALPGLLGGLVAYFAERGNGRTGRLGFALIAALGGLLLGYGVGGGRHLAAPGVRWGFALLVAALSGGAGWLCA